MHLLPGLSYVDDYISSEQASGLLSSVDAQPWMDVLRRRVQHYGYRYDYRARSVDRSMYLGALPDWIRPLARRLRSDQIFAETPEQLIVNEYEPGQGIAPHIDCIPCFGPVIAVISLGSTCLLEMSRDDLSMSILLRPQSLLVLSGEARFQWRHGIRARRSDSYEGVRLPRGRRVSLTFRQVCLLGSAE